MSKVIPVPCGDNYAYICPTEPGRCLIIDPGNTAAVCNALLRGGLTPEAVFLTHGHSDHTAGLRELLDRYPGIPVYAAGGAGTEFPENGKKLPGHEFRVLETPGHSADSICLLTEHGLFTGDTLFGAGCGRVFTGDYTVMHRSLETIAALPLETVLWFGHEYSLENLAFALTVEPENDAIHLYRNEVEAAGVSVPGLLSREKETNPFLRTRESGVIHYTTEKGAASSDPATVFATLRREKDRF